MVDHGSTRCTHAPLSVDREDGLPAVDASAGRRTAVQHLGKLPTQLPMGTDSGPRKAECMTLVPVNSALQAVGPLPRSYCISPR
jgi:hypothetical protein